MNDEAICGLALLTAVIGLAIGLIIGAQHEHNQLRNQLCLKLETTTTGYLKCKNEEACDIIKNMKVGK